MLGRTLKMAFWVTYDHVGKLILANIVWFLAVAVPGMVAWAAFVAGDASMRLLVALPFGVFALGVALPAASAGLAHMVKVLIDTRDGALGDMFRGIRAYGLRASGMGCLFLFALSSLTSSAWFYASRLRDSLPWLGYGLSALAVWALVAALLAGMYMMPALVQKKAGVLATMKLAGLLVLANPLFSVGLAIQLVALTAVALVLSPVLPLLYGAVATVLVSSAYEMLARKYAAAEAIVKGAAPDSVAAKDEQDDYLNRGVRDFLFPWKG